MSDFAWGLVLLGAYMVLVIMARWIYIARTNVIWTRAQAEAITGRLSLQSGSSPSANGKARVTPLALRRLLKKIKAQNPKSRLSGIVGWNGSHQIAQWVLMHEAERMSLSALDHAQLVARLERALGQLDELPLPRREAWEFKIRTLLADKDEAGKRMDDAYRAYLDEVLGEIGEASNGNAIQLSGLYNRATWVILVSLLPLAVLAGFGFGMLLVAGAIGGLVSRMQRLVFSTRIPVTYGSSWGRCSARRSLARWRHGPGWLSFPCCRRRTCSSSPPCRPPWTACGRHPPRCWAQRSCWARRSGSCCGWRSRPRPSLTRTTSGPRTRPHRPTRQRAARGCV